MVAARFFLGLCAAIRLLCAFLCTGPTSDGTKFEFCYLFVPSELKQTLVEIADVTTGHAVGSLAAFRAAAIRYRSARLALLSV
jgi:hypothetical protein